MAIVLSGATLVLPDRLLSPGTLVCVLIAIRNITYIRLVNQDKISLFSESHVAVPGDDFHRDLKGIQYSKL